MSSLIWLFKKQNNAKTSFYLGFMFGLGFFATSVSWIFVSIYKYGNTNVVIALLITSLFVIFLALFHGINLYLLKKFKLTNILAFASSWVLLEMFRGFVLTGFPWALLGYTQLNSSLKHYASLFGVYGVSFIILLISGLIFNLFNNLLSSINKIISISLIILIFLGSVILSKNNYNQNNYTVAIIQGNILPNDKFLLENSTSLINRIKEIYFNPTKNLINNKKIDLIIWPENSLPLEAEHYKSQDFLYDIDQFAKTNKFGLLLGVPIQHEYKYNYFYNSVLALGMAIGSYNKTNLVPFGDYVPLENLLRGLINFFNLPLSRFLAGSIKQPAIKFNNNNLLATVCYDIAYPENLRLRVVDQNPGVIVTVSEDGWFGNSLGPHQHLDIARMRAIETGRYVLRATTSGISAIIDNRGNILKQTKMFNREILTGEYSNCFNHTIWNHLGNKIILVFLLVCLGISYFKARFFKIEP